MTTMMTNNPTNAGQLVETSTGDILSELVRSAVGEHATDVHVDTWGSEATVRYRVDGILHKKHRLTLGQARRLMNQIRIAAELDVGATVEPAEGQFRWTRDGQSRDVRATVLPTAPRNESAHLRLLTTPQDWRDAEHLGLSEDEQRAIKSIVDETHGLTLIAGPTGSGKTTTLYALTGLEDLVHRVAVSIEDPAEYDLQYVRQLEVDLSRGITMSEGMRVLLRVDPDVLIVGEIRDQDSASVAAQAAMTGRQVLATVHGRDVAAAIHAMHCFAVPYQVLGGALRMVIAQQLVRRLCKTCAVPRPIEAFERDRFAWAGLASPDVVYEARGCETCGQYGYKGRVGVFEIVFLDDEFGLWISSGRSQQEIRQRLNDMGIKPITTRALERVAEGTTSMCEVVRLFMSALPASASAVNSAGGDR